MKAALRDIAIGVVIGAAVGGVISLVGYLLLK